MAVAWALNSIADTLTVLYVAAAIGGIGAGAVYGTCIGNALKWFPDHRGLAAGLTAAGFGAGSALTIIPIQGMIQSQGYEATFLWFGLGQGVVVVLLSLLLRAPRAGEAPASTRLRQSARDYTPIEVLGSPIFWVLYAMFVLVAAGGLMATAQLAPIATDFQVAKIPVSLVGLTLPALTFALSIDRVLNGLTRPFFGWVSDHIGRENTMFIAFGLEAIGILMLSAFGRDPVLFVILSGVVFFAWVRSTATYQKMICTSCGVFRTNSMKPSARFLTSQLFDSRITPTRKPSSVAVTTPNADTRSVLRMQMTSARKYVSPTLQLISRNGMSKFAFPAK